MNKQKYKIILEAESKVNRAFGGVRRELDKLQKKAVEVQNNIQRFEPIFRRMRNTGAVAFGAMSAMIGKLAYDAQTFERVRDTFDKLMRSMEESPAIISDLRRATLGMVNDLELMKSANRFAMMGIASTGDEMKTLMNMAVRLGQAMGTDATQAMEDFALMLANQSIPRLDTFGISSGKVRAEILRLMEANKGMTRDVAFTQAVLKYGAEAMNKLGDYTASSAERMAQLKVQLENTKLKIGNALIPVIERLLKKIQPVIERVTEWINKNPDLTAKILMGVTAMAGMVAILGTLGLALGSVTMAVTALSVALGVITSPITIVLGLFALITTALKNQIAEMYGVKVTWLDVWHEIQSVVDWVVDKISDAMLALMGWIDRIKNGISSLRSQFSSLISIARRAMSIAGRATGISTAVSAVRTAYSAVKGYALGGVVNAPVGQPVPAILHGGEEVIPYHRRGNDSSITININGGMFMNEQGAQDVANKIVETIRNYIRI